MLVEAEHRNRHSGTLVRAKMSSIVFPEVCPVCTEKAEDLVFVSVTERLTTDDYVTSTYNRGDAKMEQAIAMSRGITTFAIPTCLTHGSGSVRSLRTKLVAAAGFFIFLYPIIYFLLQLNVAIYYNRPLSGPALGLTVMVLALLSTLAYGLYPRALERSLRFKDVVKTKDYVMIEIKNPEYRDLFIDLNGINAELVGTGSEEEGTDEYAS